MVAHADGLRPRAYQPLGAQGAKPRAGVSGSIHRKPFARFAKRERIGDESLREAVSEIARGLVDADLGGSVVKKRVARRGEGKRGGYRVLIAVRARERAIFMFGFAKSERDNIDDDQLATLREAAAYWLSAGDSGLERAIEDGNLIEVRAND